jgi:hypothetical protein
MDLGKWPGQEDEHHIGAMGDQECNGLGGNWTTNPIGMPCKSNVKNGYHLYSRVTHTCRDCGKKEPRGESGFITDNTLCPKHIISQGNHKLTFVKMSDPGKGYTKKTYYKCAYCGTEFIWYSATATDKPKI